MDIAESTRHINDAAIPADHIILMAGFTAGNERGELVVLGRNGSDYSAAVLAACLRADCCEIWTDVDGVYICDPNQVSDAGLLSQLSYQEAMELSYFGAKVLRYHRAVPNFLSYQKHHQSSGSRHVNRVTSSEEGNPVKGITHLNNMAMINISVPGMKGMIGMAARVFAAPSLSSRDPPSVPSRWWWTMTAPPPAYGSRMRCCSMPIRLLKSSSSARAALAAR